MTCEFTVYNEVETLYYNGESILDKIKRTENGSACGTDCLHDWKTSKTFTVSGVPNAKLVVSGRSKEPVNRDPACTSQDGAGFAIFCTSGFTSSGHWEAFGSTLPIDLQHVEGRGTGWATPCNTASNFFLPGRSTRQGGQIGHLWATNEQWGVLRGVIFA